MKGHCLYHLRFVDNIDLADGYIGVCSDFSKRKYRHFNDPVDKRTKEAIESGSVEMVRLLVAPKDYCLEIEKILRPQPNTGWNIKSGGKDSRFPEDMKQLMSEKKIGNCNVGKGKDHHFHGKTGKHSIRFGTKGILHPSYSGEWVTPLGSFGSLNLACDAHGLTNSAIRYRCVQSKNFNDWYFKPKEENND